jgi:hypothetical protein
MAEALEAHFSRGGDDDVEWLRGFIRIVSGEQAPVPPALPPPLAAGVRAVRRIHRLPWQLELPVREVAATPFPKTRHLRRPPPGVRGGVRRPR